MSCDVHQLKEDIALHFTLGSTIIFSGIGQGFLHEYTAYPH